MLYRNGVDSQQFCFGDSSDDQIGTAKIQVTAYTRIKIKAQNFVSNKILHFQIERYDERVKYCDCQVPSSNREFMNPNISITVHSCLVKNPSGNFGCHPVLGKEIQESHMLCRPKYLQDNKRSIVFPFFISDICFSTA